MKSERRKREERDDREKCPSCPLESLWGQRERKTHANLIYSREGVNILRITYHFLMVPAGYPLQNAGFR